MKKIIHSIKVILDMLIFLVQSISKDAYSIIPFIKSQFCTVVFYDRDVLDVFRCRVWKKKNINYICLTWPLYIKKYCIVIKEPLKHGRLKKICSNISFKNDIGVYCEKDM